MRTASIVLLATSALLACTLTVSAQTTGAAPATNTTTGTVTNTAAPLVATAPTTDDVASQAPDYKTAMVCKTMAPTTGTRLGARRVCQTQYAWDEERKQVARDIANQQLKNRDLLDPSATYGLMPTGKTF